MKKKLVLVSKLAFYPMHWEAFRHLCRYYDVFGSVIALETPKIPSVHRQLGLIDPKEEARKGFAPEIYFIPQSGRIKQWGWMKSQLNLLDPDIVWFQGEPVETVLLAILFFHLFREKPRIVTAVCENIFDAGSPFTRMAKRILMYRFVRSTLWSRLDGLLGIATASIKGVRAAGMPRKVPAISLVAGALNPPDSVERMDLPFARENGDFVVGFVGRICEEKGWKILLDALVSLPPCVKCVMVGDGPQNEELKSAISQAPWNGRVLYLGLMPKTDLWRLYGSIDCLVLPSLTSPRWKEQFGSVLTDGMAMGLPLVGSDSGAIPEVIGPAGLIVPENRPDALANAIKTLLDDPALRNRFSEIGKRRMKEEFSIPAYAGKIAAALGLQLL